ncbi:MAG TPA: ABC transporter substrate-binding protein [Solirubrobacterales bacterium]|nr:ABC transporter substrate-binding protein [Solirubrobacterales bacterium]
MRAILLAAVVLAAAVVGACGGGDEKPTGPQKLDLTIGNLTPLTGYLDPFGKSAQRAADVAAEEIRKAAAKAGARHTVKVQHVDDKSEPKTALAEAKKLVKAGASCLTGPYGSGTAARVGAQVSVPSKVLQITPSAGAVQLTDVNDRGYLNRVVPPDTMQADALAEYMAGKLKGGARGKSVNIGTLESTYGAAVTKRFEQVWRGKGGQVGRKATYKADSTIFTAPADLLAQGKPDAWVFIDFVDTYLKVARELETNKSARWTPRKTFATESLASPRLPTAGPTVSDGLSGVAISAPEKGEPAEAFDTAYKRVPGTTRQTYDAQQFDAVVLCYLAAVAAGTTKGEDMKDELRGITAAPGRKYTWLQLDQAIRALESGADINYEGVSGPIELNDDGDATAAVYDVFRFKDGKLDLTDQIAIPVGSGGV